MLIFVIWFLIQLIYIFFVVWFDRKQIVDQETLEAVEEIKAPVVICIAAWFGKARLIDNIEINAWKAYFMQKLQILLSIVSRFVFNFLPQKV